MEGSFSIRLVLYLCLVLAIVNATESETLSMQRKDTSNQKFYRRVKRQAIVSSSSTSGVSSSHEQPVSGSASIYLSSSGGIGGGQTYNYPFGHEQIEYETSNSGQSQGQGHTGQISGGSISGSGYHSSLQGGHGSSDSGQTGTVYHQPSFESHEVVFDFGESSQSSGRGSSGTSHSQSHGSGSVSGNTAGGPSYSSGTNQGTSHTVYRARGVNPSSGSNTGYVVRTNRRPGTRYVSGTNQASESNTGYVSGSNSGAGSNRGGSRSGNVYHTRTSYTIGSNGRSSQGSGSSSGTGPRRGVVSSSGSRGQSGYNNGLGSSSTQQRTIYRTRNTGQGGYVTNRNGNGGYGSNDGCPNTGVEMRIDGMSCSQAVQRHGSGLCYLHERSSRQCCQVCTPRRNPNKPGCEYGDRSQQCNDIRPGACYNFDNRHVCCERCERLRRTNIPGCEWGDRSDQCQVVLANPGLCYNADNRRMCCQTCEHLRDSTKPDCEWGDHDNQNCRPFQHNSTDTRINCYSPRIRNLCCNSCQRIKEWVPNNLPAGCEYGDHPVTFISNQRGDLRCSTYFHHFPSSHCDNQDSDVARYCCHTCYRRHQYGGRG